MNATITLHLHDGTNITGQIVDTPGLPQHILDRTLALEVRGGTEGARLALATKDGERELRASSVAHASRNGETIWRAPYAALDPEETVGVVSLKSPCGQYLIVSDAQIAWFVEHDVWPRDASGRYMRQRGYRTQAYHLTFFSTAAWQALIHNECSAIGAAVAPVPVEVRTNKATP